MVEHHTLQILVVFSMCLFCHAALAKTNDGEKDLTKRSTSPSKPDDDVLKQPAVLAALEKIKKDAIATVTSAFIKAQQKKSTTNDVPKTTENSKDGSGASETEASSGSGESSEEKEESDLMQHEKNSALKAKDNIEISKVEEKKATTGELHRDEEKKLTKKETNTSSEQKQVEEKKSIKKETTAEPKKTEDSKQEIQSSKDNKKDSTKGEKKEATINPNDDNKSKGDGEQRKTGAPENDSKKAPSKEDGQVKIVEEKKKEEEKVEKKEEKESQNFKEEKSSLKVDEKTAKEDGKNKQTSVEENKTSTVTEDNKKEEVTTDAKKSENVAAAAGVETKKDNESTVKEVKKVDSGTSEAKKTENVKDEKKAAENVIKGDKNKDNTKEATKKENEPSKTISSQQKQDSAKTNQTTEATKDAVKSSAGEVKKESDEIKKNAENTDKNKDASMKADASKKEEESQKSLAKAENVDKSKDASTANKIGAKEEESKKAPVKEEKSNKKEKVELKNDKHDKRHQKHKHHHHHHHHHHKEVASKKSTKPEAAAAISPATAALLEQQKVAYQTAMMQTVMAQNPSLQTLGTLHQNIAAVMGASGGSSQPTTGNQLATPLMTASAVEKLDWDRIQNDKKTFEDFAKKGNIPVAKLEEIFSKPGATRSQIAKNTLALLQNTIKTQDDLAQLFKFETGAIAEENKNALTQSIKKHDLVNETAPAENLTNHKDFTVPKDVPSNCIKFVKQYSNGELTLADYVKSLKICKQNEVITKQIAKTTPQQREAVATMKKIQDEAYKYALNTMKNYSLSARDQANAVMSRWRTQSFGNSTSGKAANIPDAVKMFMGIQNKTVDLIGGDVGMNFIKNSQAGASSPVIAAGGEGIKSEDVSPLSIFNSEQRSKVAASVTQEQQKKKSQTPNTLLLAATPGSALPLTGSLVEAIKASNAGDSSTPLASLKSLDIEKKPVVTGAELAAETFMASLANPIFKQMPVDKSLAAALKSMSDIGDMESTGNKLQVLQSLQKRRRSLTGAGARLMYDLMAKRARKVTKKHMWRRNSDSGITKPMERSSMMAPVLSTQQGPKLMDKIRDMGRVIATP